MLSKKDYVAIAEILNTEIKALKNEQDMPYFVIRNIMGSLSDYFKSDNPQFNKEKFINACLKQRETE